MKILQQCVSASLGVAAADPCDDSECLGYRAAFTFDCRGTSVFELLAGASAFSVFSVVVYAV